MLKKLLVGRSAEFYLIIIPSVLALCAGLFLVPRTEHFQYALAYFVQYNILRSIFLWAAIGTVVLLAVRQLLGLKTEALKTVGSSVYISALLFLVILIPSFMTSYAFTSVSIDAVIRATSFMARLEQGVFGSQPVFLIHAAGVSTLSEAIILYAYSLLDRLMYLMLLVSIFDKRVFREFTLSLFVTTCIGAVIWKLVPVIAPAQMYLYNIFGLPLDPMFAGLIAAHPMSPLLGSYVSLLYGFWQDPQNRFIAASAFPSMHVAWSVITAYCAVRLWKPLAYAFGPYVFVTFIAIIYTYQHFFIDGLAGLLLAAAVIFAVRKMLDREGGKVSDGYYSLDSLKETLFALRRKLTR